MSNFGSGNQGIAATIPVVVIAERFGASEEQLARALIMSHLGPSTSSPTIRRCRPFAATRSPARRPPWPWSIWRAAVSSNPAAIQNVLSDSAGMVCDGAKASCAMKVSTSSGAAVRGFLMALNSHAVSGQGIVAGNVEQTIRNVGQMVKDGMSATDSTIIDIMSA